MLLGVVFLVLMHPSTRSLWAGGVLALAGAGLRMWAAGYLEKGKSLAQGGPYSFTRNPLYLGSLLMATGVLVAGQGYWLLVPFAIFFGVIYFPVMRAEEAELAEKYGDSYLQYARHVPAFLPFPGSGFRAGAPLTAFAWSRVFRNGEHRTAAGLALIAAFLVLRAKWPAAWPHL